MSIEIELKAHVHDKEALNILLHEKAKYACTFEKRDTYWVTSGLHAPAIRRVRVRGEKRILPDESVLFATLATYKTKEVTDSIEVNEEWEFEVNPGPEFERFLEGMGFKPEISKRKQGWAFFHNGITAELVEVDGLGWFIELEILAADLDADKREETLAEAKQRLLDFLAELGINKEAIESRYYTEMLGNTTNNK